MKYILILAPLTLSLTIFANDKKQIIQSALAKLKASGIEQSAVNKGVMSPSVTINGKKLSDLYKEKPVILKFYRGSWCPYCQKELVAYNKFAKEIAAKGYHLIFLTPDTKKEIKKFVMKNDIEFEIYQDVNNTIAKKFGLAFKLEADLLKVYKEFGIDLEKAQDNKLNELPLPGTYIIQKDGKINFAYIDADYKKRIYPKELLKEL